MPRTPTPSIRLAAALLAGAVATAPALAETLVVGSDLPRPLAHGDVAVGLLEEMTDLGAVSALVPADDGSILVASPPTPGAPATSTIHRLSADDGAVLAQWSIPGEVVALAPAGDDVWSATADGRLTRHDAGTGGALAVMHTHRWTTALASDGALLYQGTSNGEVHAAPVANPIWKLAMKVFAPIESLSLRGTWLLVGVKGHVYIHERDTGKFIYGYNVPNDAATIALSGNQVVVGGRDGSIALVDPNAGTVAEHGAISVRGTAGPYPIAALAVLDPAPFAHLTPPLSFASIGAGNPIAFDLEVSPELAGRPYLLLGSVSGTTPGLTVDGVSIPLNPDPYLVLTFHGSPTLAGALGGFDVDNPLGVPVANASLKLPAGLSPVAVGLTLEHAFLVYDPNTLTVVAASNAARTIVTP